MSWSRARLVKDAYMNRFSVEAAYAAVHAASGCLLAWAGSMGCRLHAQLFMLMRVWCSAAVL